jgi:hypothetical protein
MTFDWPYAGATAVCTKRPPRGDDEVQSGRRARRHRPQIARSRDDGKTWTVLPMIPGTTTGTSTFVVIEIRYTTLR